MSVKSILENSQRALSIVEAPAGIRKLPRELFVEIVPWLDLETIQACASVSREMRIITLAAVGDCEIQSTRELIEVVMSHLDETLFWENRDVLRQILGEISNRHVIGLKPLKDGMALIKEDLISVIEMLDPVSIENLGKLSVKCPRFMENIFQVAAIYREIHRVVNGSYLNQTGDDLIVPALHLAQQGEVDEAVAVRGIMSCDQIADIVLRLVVLELLKGDRIKKSFEITMHGSRNNSDLQDAIDLIILLLQERGIIDKALVEIMTIADVAYRDRVLERVSLALCQVREMSKFWQFVMNISADGPQRDQYLCNLSLALMHHGEEPEAWECAKALSDQRIKDFTMDLLRSIDVGNRKHLSLSSCMDLLS